MIWATAKSTFVKRAHARPPTRDSGPGRTEAREIEVDGDAAPMA